MKANLQTVAAISTFILAMVKYPIVQVKGRAELDTVLGMNQLPDFSDEDSLPYITAIAMEVLRWQVSGMLPRHQWFQYTYDVPSSRASLL